jgi:hypothetical protein
MPNPTPEQSEPKPFCELCGYEFDTQEEADTCEDGHLMAEDEMGVFDA